MTADEQQQVNAMRAFFERQCGNLASEGANAAVLAEKIAMELNATKKQLSEAQAEIAKLRPKDDAKQK